MTVHDDLATLRRYLFAFHPQQEDVNALSRVEDEIARLERERDRFATQVSDRTAYEEAANALLRETGCTVRKYRQRNTGTAYTDADDWGIEVPRPRGPVSFGVFAHEVAHQDLHRHNSAPRWLEEIEAWEYALAAFERFGLDGIEKSRADAAKAIVWACVKASKRCSPESAHKILMRVPDWVADSAGGGSLWAELLAKVEGMPA